MYRILMIALMCVAGSAFAFQPRTGHWFNPAESGRGFNMDFQNGTVVITFYSYNPDGSVQWYLATGPSTNGGRSFSAPLQKFAGGQCLACSYNGQPQVTGTDGNISVNFTSEVSAIITLPSGRTTTVQPLNFGFGDPPQGLLGQWVFVENIGGIDFADRYTFTEILPAGSTAADGGTGIATDPVKTAGCQYYGPGAFAGKVLCVHGNSSGNIADQYIWVFGLDETFEGQWISPTTSSAYPMKGFKVVSSSGVTKAAVIDEESSARKAALSQSHQGADSFGLAQQFEALQSRLRESLR